MPIRVTESDMTSDVSPEYAYLVSSGGAAAWRLSWLPERPLTREQAMAGMELDALVSDPALVGDPMAFALMQERAHRLGMVFAQALLLLATRMAARTARAGAEITPGEPAEGARGGDIGVPRKVRRHDRAPGPQYLTGPLPHTEPPVVSP
ncbi:hypothetical protein [Nocardia sp. NPDC057353]|uniref:hypothetical protein n=1 Tax=Nocardia sp. NPDC057353 TaxID=3346104 RepID=UPI003640FDD7